MNESERQAEIERLTAAMAQSIDEILERLVAAERFAVLFGWGAARDPREEFSDALTQLWQQWAALVPDGFLSPARHPELNGEAITALAAERRRIREDTLAAIRAPNTTEDRPNG